MIPRSGCSHKPCTALGADFPKGKAQGEPTYNEHHVFVPLLPGDGRCRCGDKLLMSQVGASGDSPPKGIPPPELAEHSQLQTLP